jgi:hypothetical protein
MNRGRVEEDRRRAGVKGEVMGISEMYCNFGTYFLHLEG